MMNMDMEESEIIVDNIMEFTLHTLEHITPLGNWRLR